MLARAARSNDPGSSVLITFWKSSFMIAPIIRFCADYEFDSVTPFHPASCVAPGSTFHSQAGGPSATALWHPLLPSPARDFAAELSCCGAWYYSLLSLVIDTYVD